AAGENVGTYAINQGTLSAGTNYTITFVSSNLTISARSLTVTADNLTKLLGAPLPDFTATYNGFVNGDTTNVLDAQVSLNSTASISSPPGDYPINATGGADLNYAITRVNGVLTVPEFRLGQVTVDESGDITLQVNVATNASITMEVSDDLHTW